MSDIPLEIVTDFLSRVPAKCLLRFRCVSKSWRDVIDSPDFIKMHLNRTLQTNSDRKIILPSYYLYWADFDELEETNTAVYTELDHPYKRSDSGTEILGSCHGLLCLDTGDEYSDIVLWNPTTRKHLKLPLSGIELEDSGECFFCCTWCMVFGFGYDKVSDDYKVLRIIQSYSENEAKVFSLKSNSWRIIRDFPYYLKYKRTHGVLAAGSLHWIVSKKPDMDKENLIAAFDLETEEYRLVPGPNYSKKRVYVTVGVLGESLSVVCNYYKLCCMDIWVMKNYGVEESWTKLFKVAQSDVRIKPLEFVVPVAYSKSGREVFMVQNGRQPLWYDIEKRKFRHSSFCISSVPTLMEHEMCFGSLVRLDGGISGSAGRVGDRKQGVGSQGTKKKSKKKRDDFLSQGFKLKL